MIENFRKDVAILRKSIEDYLISLLKEYDVISIDCYPLGDTPTIIDSTSDTDTYTLDRINLYLGKDGNYIEFDCSSACTNDSVYVSDMDIELLIDVYEWVKANEVELFEDVE